MKSKALIKRIAAMMMALMMTVSMSGGVIEEVFAETDEAEVQSEMALDAEASDSGAKSGDVASGESDSQTSGSEEQKPAAAEGSADVSSSDAVPAEESVESTEPAGEGVVEEANEEVPEIPEDPENPGEDVPVPEITGYEVTKYAPGANNTVDADIKWDAVEGAAKYIITAPDNSKHTVEETNFTLTGLERELGNVFNITAVDADGDETNPIAASELVCSTFVPEFKVAGGSETSEYVDGRIEYNNTIKVSWDKVPGADGYIAKKKEVSLVDRSVFKNEELTEIEIKSGDVTEAEFEHLYPGRKYIFEVTAMIGDKEIMSSDPDAVKYVKPVLNELTGRTRSNRTVNPGKLGFPNGSTELRAYAGQKPGGYAVAQGGATDGIYAYYLLASSSTQKGRIAKVRVGSSASDRTLQKVSETLETTHGNGMTYDSRRHRLVVIGRDDSVRGDHKQELTVIDADSLTITQQQDLNYKFYASDSDYFDSGQRSKGLAAISYSPKFDVYIAKQRGNNNLIVIDPDTLMAIGLIKTMVNQYGGAGQAMDGDDQYVYMLKSGYGSSNTNVILTLDWNGNQLIGANGSRRDYIPEYWACLNNKYPVAMYTVKTPYEAENVYHVYDSNGTQTFYMTEYNPNQQYSISYQKKAYKVKWKKVKKKVKVKKKYKKKVKWKKKKNGKWKYKKVTRYKYKWKKKKVWKYKTKYKTVTVKTPTYKERHDYVYCLGNL